MLIHFEIRRDNYMNIKNSHLGRGERASEQAHALMVGSMKKGTQMNEPANE